ncbi:67 kDa myosin-cross-reactive antigen family protein [Talaromyces proteolyticus]|uniref:67 kDa myosin-cross-reactive antigen family protein n=1 Tax=Talaromyces proteolyticus TaxID=1131652 RepID=A0AAD4KFI8_9EURO|nr:67 kDa myosin-cross-reactive antigen family protein [Talaromyces proteolyticus]KAH8689826.1 67 kDa myosin-cross-reactive antigen family protein [Talaromyces proteolyticus]
MGENQNNIPSIRNDHPSDVQAWLIGSGIASITAAVHLIRDAGVPGSNIHILDEHAHLGGGMESFGNAQEGYFLPFECHPYFHGGCIENLLGAVPSITQQGKSLLDTVYAFERTERPAPKQTALTRAVKRGDFGPEAVRTEGINVGLKHRLELIKLLLQSEEELESKTIDSFFDPPFFETVFWMLWSTTFALQPYHSVVEFQRHLRKYLEEIQSLNNLKVMNRTRFNLYESVTIPIIHYLESKEVDFRLNAKVTDLRFSSESDLNTVSEIELMSNGAQHLVPVSPRDVVITTLGSTALGATFGSNISPPPRRYGTNRHASREWELWEKLSSKSAKFGNPALFLSHTKQSMVVIFTTTFLGMEFLQLYEKLTQDSPGTGALLTLTQSNWLITISIPHQPLFSNQPADINVIYGYALNPTVEGNYMKKPMLACSGEEILLETLSHLDFPVSSMLATSKTIPCAMPLGTAPFLAHSRQDRPAVIPEGTTNIACVGQFAEIPEDTTLTVEYSVRGAKLAVNELMGLPDALPKIRKSLLLEVFDLML